MRRFELEFSWRWAGDLKAETASPPFRLLKAVRATGSLGHAASAIGVSYRHAWGLLVLWEHRIGQPLVKLERGRGAKLTALGEKLLWAEQRVRARLAPGLESMADELERDLAPEFGETRAVLTINASHDLLLARLRESLMWEPELEIHLDFRGSLDSLAALWRDRCQLAGFHIPQPADPRTAAEMGRWLKRRTHRVIEFADREQGLMVSAGNPKRILGLNHLARDGVRFINRQRGSGTRLLFDRMLDEAAVDARRIEGYQSEEFTHLAVAATVAGGGADAAFGIRAAAAQFGLEFLPLAWERYAFACRRETLDQPMVQRFIAALRGVEFRDLAARLPGYDASRAGKILEVDGLLAPAADGAASPATRRAARPRRSASAPAAD